MLTDELSPLDFTSAVTLLGDAMSRVVLQALEGTGLRHAHGYLIQRLLVAPATATEIAADLGITQQAVSKSVKELVTLGLVEFVQDTKDNRRRPVQLTKQGRQAVDISRQTRRAIDQRIRHALGDQDFDHTFQALAAVIDTFGLATAVQRRTVPPPTPDLL